MIYDLGGDTSMIHAKKKYAYFVREGNFDQLKYGGRVVTTQITSSERSQI